MRLAAQAKMGYYPAPDGVIPIIARYLKRQREGMIRILDPCAGTGAAIKQIGNAICPISPICPEGNTQAETYGIEIDLERGNQAKSILDKCLITDYQNTRISHGSFSLLWLNPPLIGQSVTTISKNPKGTNGHSSGTASAISVRKE